MEDKTFNSCNISAQTASQSDPPTMSPSAHGDWTSVCVSAIHMVAHMSVTYSPATITTTILSLSDHGFQIWHHLRHVAVDPSLYLFDRFIYASLFFGDLVHGNLNRHETFLNNSDRDNAIGIIALIT